MVLIPKLQLAHDFTRIAYTEQTHVILYTILSLLTLNEIKVLEINST